MNRIELLPSVASINWNHPKDTLACLRSMMALHYPADWKQACSDLQIRDIPSKEGDASL